MSQYLDWEIIYAGGVITRSRTEIPAFEWFFFHLLKFEDNTSMQTKWNRVRDQLKIPQQKWTQPPKKHMKTTTSINYNKKTQDLWNSANNHAKLTIKNLKLSWFGHIGHHDTLLKIGLVISQMLEFLCGVTPHFTNTTNNKTFFFTLFYRCNRLLNWRQSARQPIDKTSSIHLNRP